MVASAGGKVRRGIHRCTYHWTAHQVHIDHTAAEQCAHTKKYPDAVGIKRVAGVHGMRHEWGEQPHQQAREYADHDALARHRGPSSAQVLVGSAIKYDR